MPKEKNGAARVIAQEGSRVQVEHKGGSLTVPMQGFPPGFTLRPGSRVILYEEASGLSARPLTRAIRSRVQRADLQKRGTLEVGGRRVEMQASTVVEDAAPEGARGERAADDYEVWIVEGPEGEATPQVIAARPANPGRRP